MRLAALYDIHGNLPALEAVLEEVRRANVDQIVVGGDVVLGPMQRDTLDCLLNLEIPVQFILGNCESAVLAQMADKDPGVPASVRESVRWSAQHLRGDYERTLAGWPITLRVKIEGLGEVLFCHATPRDNNEIFTRLTPDERLLPIFQPLNVPIVVCGHTHMQMDRQVGRTRVVNAGSVGMPFGEPGADWALLGPDVELRHTMYDLENAARRIRESAYPQSREFADRYVLHPPSEKETLAAFGKAEMK